MAHDEFGQIINETQQGNATPRQQWDKVVDETINKAYTNQSQTKEQESSESITPRQEWDKVVDENINKSYANQQKAREQENVESTERITPIVTGGEEFERKYGYDKPAPEGDTPMVRQDILNHFRDQNRPFAPGESVPLENPSKDQVQKNELSDIKPGQHSFLQKKLGELDKQKSEEQDPLRYLQQKLVQEQSRQQEKFAQDVSKEIRDAELKARHNEALDSNVKANEGFSGRAPLSETGQNFFANQDRIAEEAKADARHQEALDSNAKANEGFTGRAPLSETGQNFFAREDLISENAQLKEEISSLRKDIEDIKAKLDALLSGNTPTVEDQSTSVVQDTEQIEPLPEQAEGEPIPIVVPQQETVNTPEQVQQEPETVNAPAQEALTPEQKYTQLMSERDTLLNGRPASELTNEERIRYIEMTIALDAMKLSMGQVSEETERRQRKKERIVALVAGIAGAGVGFGMAATAPVSVAAVVAVTLGGRFASPLIKKWGTHLEAKATALKFEDRIGKTPEQIAEIDKRIKRNAWWGKRLGEVAAVVSGGTAGFGIGVLAHNIFASVTAGAGSTPQPTGPEVGGTTGTGVETGTVTPPQGGEAVAETLSDPGLVVDGRVNLPDSAWNGNLAGEPTGNLPGGEFNYSNYAGGVHEMAAHQLNKDLMSAGVTPEQLSTLNTRDIHVGLLNGYLESINSGVTDPNLVDILGKMNSEAAKNLLSTITSK